MTETEWMASDNPAAMLRHLTHDVHVAEDAVGDHPRSVQLVGNRQLRLFACACCRLSGTAAAQVDEYEKSGPPKHDDVDDHTDVQWAKGWTELGRNKPTLAHRAALLRDICGNPFQQTTLPFVCLNCGSGSQEPEVDYPCCGRCGRVAFGCLWLTPTVRAIAQAAYEERQSDGFLDPHRLLVLADALVDAGCDHEGLLRHLRDSPHVRGCWVLDLILGRQ